MVLLKSKARRQLESSLTSLAIEFFVAWGKTDSTETARVRMLADRVRAADGVTALEKARRAADNDVVIREASFMQRELVPSYRTLVTTALGL